MTVIRKSLVLNQAKLCTEALIVLNIKQNIVCEFLAAGQPLLCQAAWQGNVVVVKKLLVNNLIYLCEC